MAPILKNSRKSMSAKRHSITSVDKENSFLHGVSEFQSRIRRRESIRLKYKVSKPLISGMSWINIYYNDVYNI